MKFKTRHLRFVTRSLRAGALRLLLRATLLVCAIEDWLRPPPRAAGKRVLVLVFGGLGDCLLFDPLFRRMREQWPGVCIDVISGGFEAMWHGLESIDHVLYFSRDTVKLPWTYVRS